MQQPNIVYIHTHDAGRVCSPYGYKADTPNMQRLAEEALLFRNAFCAAPTCSPSRAALLSGSSPHNTGMLGLAHRGFSMDPSMHIAGLLREHGYETVLSGIQHVVPDREKLPYNTYLGNTEVEMGGLVASDWAAYDLANASAVADYITNDLERPTFLSFGMFNPHRPFPDHGPGQYTKPPGPLPDNARTRRDYAAFLNALTVADQAVGRVLDALRTSGKESETVVILTTDHGVPFPQMKCNLTDDGIGVALIVRAPGYTKRGTVSDSLVSHIDVVPTICELAGLVAPEWAQGTSLVPVLKTPEVEIRDRVFAEVSFHAAYEPTRCVRTKRFKYIRNYDSGAGNRLPANCDDSPSKDVVLEAGLFDQPRPKEELYDLLLDPAEKNNLADHTDFQSVKQDLTEQLGTWMKETDDPLQPGWISPPKGARLNRPDCVSPTEKRYVET